MIAEKLRQIIREHLMKSFYMPELNQLKNHKPEVKLQIEGGPVALQNAKNQYTR